MKCNDVGNQMMRYIDGQLTEHDASKVAHHLDICPLCRGKYADEVEMASAFDNEIEGMSGSYFVGDVMAGIEIALNKQYEKLGVNPNQKVIVAVGVIWAAIIGIVVWRMDELFVNQTASSTFYSWVQVQAAGLSSELGSMMTWTSVTGQNAYNSSISSLAAFTGEYFGLIAAVTIASAVAGIALLGGLRGKLAEELTA